MKRGILMVLLLMQGIGCGLVEVRSVRPVPVGVSGAAQDGTAGVGRTGDYPIYRPPTPTAPMPLVRGQIFLPRYYLNIRTPCGNAEAEVFIDGTSVFSLRSGEAKVYEMIIGPHEFLAQVYCRERRPVPYGYGHGEQPEEYLGCAQGQFTIDPNVPAARNGIFWELVLPPPSPIC